MRVGAGRAKIALPEGFLPTEGFTRQLDALHVRALVLESGERLALVSVEMTSLPPEEIAALKSIASEQTGIKPDHCWVMATHTFSAPHLMPDHALPDEEARQNKRTLQRAVREAAKAAVREAAERMREATLSLGTAECRINANRDIELPDGWWIGLGGQGPSDHELTLLRLDDVDGNPIALLTHFAVQPSVLDGSEVDGGKLVSGDLAGRLSAGLERQYPGAIAMFLVGAAGDQSPVKKAKAMGLDGVERDLGREGPVILDELAAQMLAAALEANQMREPMPDGPIEMASTQIVLPGQKMAGNIREMRPTKQYAYQPDGERTTEISVVRIGALALVGVQPELNCVTAREIHRRCEAKALVLTMVNGGAKYAADAESYDRLTYEARNSWFAKGAAERLRDEVIELMNPASGGM